MDHEDWGRELNLEIVWTETDHWRDERSTGSTSRGHVWIRTPCRVAASISINGDKQYAIYTQGLYGLSTQQHEALEKYLESRGWIKRIMYSGK
jgi:hypothetical protein